MAKFQRWLGASGFDACIYYSTYLPPHLFYLINLRKGERLLATTDLLFNSIPGVRRLGGVIIAEAVKRSWLKTDQISSKASVDVG